MSEHQGGAGGVPERGPTMDAAQGYGGAPDAAREQGPQVAAEGYGQTQGGVHASAQAGAAGPQGYGQPQQPGQGQFAYGGMPPGYAQPAPDVWAGAPHQGGYYPPPQAGGVPYGYAPPPPPPGAYPPDAFQSMHQGHAYGAGPSAGQGQGAGMSDLMNEVANGGNGLSTLSKMLDFNDPDFWKGALVGAAAVLLLTSDSVQNALFKSGNGGKESDA